MSSSSAALVRQAIFLTLYPPPIRIFPSPRKLSEQRNQICRIFLPGTKKPENTDPAPGVSQLKNWILKFKRLSILRNKSALLHLVLCDKLPHTCSVYRCVRNLSIWLMMVFAYGASLWTSKTSWASIISLPKYWRAAPQALRMMTSGRYFSRTAATSS